MTRATWWRVVGRSWCVAWLSFPVLSGSVAACGGDGAGSERADVLDTPPEADALDGPDELAESSEPSGLTGGAGLGVDWATRPAGPVVRHDPDSADFTATPWPSDRDRGADGAPDLARFPNPGRVEMIDGFKTYGAASLDGFGRNSAAWFQLDRAIDPDALPAPATTMSDPSAAIQWISLTPGAEDYGARLPVVARMVEDAADPYYLGPTIASHPVYGFPLRDGGTYCVVLTRGLTDRDGRYLQADPDLLPDLAANPSFAPLRGWLPTSPLALADLASATCFTAQDATRELFEVARELERLEPV